MCVCALSAVSPLEGFSPQEWVVFERALVIRDLFTGGNRVFHSTADAQDFRTALYRHYGAHLFTLHRWEPRVPLHHQRPGLPYRTVPPLPCALLHYEASQICSPHM